ncbi:hypothetical protein N657DRAFT_680294 [Parathielavia appendiculata]|uniref:Uncharacterized protein n=1 Tax=Parathielavia appendiculata TaxID=2587402 RepID=A0AAN6U0Z2_9PEZI|nr:hypothetical protein N657DRAFT_680294 [Parathielavia appendiculata]
MSGYGLTSGKPGQQQAEADDYFSRPSDSEFEERIPSKSRPDILSSAIRGFKKITPGGPSLRPAQLSLRRPAETHAPTLERAAASAPLLQGQHRQPLAQHARSLSLQDSLAKPLPEPPPPELSPASPFTPLALQAQSQSLATAFDTEEQKNDSRPGTMESASSMEMSGGLYPRGHLNHGQDVNFNSSQSSLASSSRQDGQDDRGDNLTPKSIGPLSAGPSPSIGQSRTQTGGTAVGTATPSAHLSGLMCNVHRTTGREPHPLVGATTTILGDKLYVFGGRILSRSRPAPLTADLYELDLIRRHWTKLETTGDIPPPRYFHSMCALGDTKMVCYGGMSPTTSQKNIPQDQQPEVTVMSDIYIYDVPTKKWTFIPTQDAPQGRYAHCACVLPSSATFASHRAPLSALQHNPSTGNPNEGRIGINIDGTGGAEMVVVGGQDASNHYIEQISVFNLRSLKWVSTQPLGKSCGAYRSVVAPLPPSVTAKLGKAFPGGGRQEVGGISQEAREPGSSMLIYSNYNFLDVKLELQIRSPDGHLTERAMSGTYSPPGLRFPNGGIIDTHFVVSGTYLTSSKQEYALWALDLRTLTWSRIDAGGAVFSQGSWNRGVLWNRRNTFVVLGNRKRSLVDDYNHRRINFSNVCMVELEAFGFYDNPRKTAPMSGFVSASSPYTGPGLSLARKAGFTAGGRFHSRAAEELGEKALALRELADMDFLCIGGERIPVNSRIVARRWGPYFVQLLREGTATQDGSDAATLRSNSVSGPSGSIRASNLTITPTNMSGSTLYSISSSTSKASSSMSPPSGAAAAAATDQAAINTAPTPRTLPPNSRPRCLYLPHTYLTVQALLHFLYTSSLPAPSSPLCTPQILCSLLQIARPYRIDGLLEAVVERLHGLLDSRNAAAVFNATAMAAGGGRGIDGTLNPNFFPLSAGLDGLGGAGGAGEAAASQVNGTGGRSVAGSEIAADGTAGAAAGAGGKNKLKISTVGLPGASRPSNDEPLSATSASEMSGSEWSASEFGDSERGGGREIWGGDLSSVVGLQKRGLRGLMEGRRMRERTGAGAGTAGGVGVAGQGQQGAQYGQVRVGLGIAEGRSIQPILIHGNLWIGNAPTRKDTGEPMMFDASAFWGHNENELSIMRPLGNDWAGNAWQATTSAYPSLSLGRTGMLATRSMLRENYTRGVLHLHSLSVLTEFLRRTYTHDSALYPDELGSAKMMLGFGVRVLVTPNGACEVVLPPIFDRHIEDPVRHVLINYPGTLFHLTTLGEDEAWDSTGELVGRYENSTTLGEPDEDKHAACSGELSPPPPAEWTSHNDCELLVRTRRSNKDCRTGFEILDVSGLTNHHSATTTTSMSVNCLTKGLLTHVKSVVGLHKSLLYFVDVKG